MSAPGDVVAVVRQWVQKAENDLRNAKHTLTMGEDCPYDTVCFHAQQCVEKQETLTDYATVARYPGEPDPSTRREAEEAVIVAVRVRDAARTVLPPEALDK